MQILDVSARCASLTISLTYELYIKLIGETRSFPKLRRLSLRPFSNRGTSTRYGKALDATNLWDYLPVVTDLEIVCSTTDCLRSIPFDLTNLSIRLSGNASRLFFPFIDMLGSSQTLTSVTFHATFCKTEPARRPDKPASARSTSITTLCLKDYGVRLLDYITLPSLSSLSVNTLRWQTPHVHAEIVGGSVPSIIRFLGRSNPPLENFALWKSELTPSMLSSMLSYLPRLQAFDLRVNLFGNLEFLTDFFDRLSRSDSNGTFEVLPCLSRLLIGLDSSKKGYDVAKSVDEVDGKHFLKMIRERGAQVNSPIRYVRIVVDANGFCNLAESDVDVMYECERLVGWQVVTDDAERSRR
ncbi:hypothetical protein BDZ89DRAFT_1067682 [Hymenopellis radicata]|nr:hypothetical protein BDZ89DRAFT_1067682 [Hymenopellis radicata]